MLKTNELAKELGISASTVRGYAEAGQIPCTRTLGGHRRFDLDEVREAIARQQGWGELEPLGEGEAPRLDETRSTPLQLARGDWHPSIDSAGLDDGATGEHGLSIPFIGVPGESRFTVGEGARV